MKRRAFVALLIGSARRGESCASAGGGARRGRDQATKFEFTPDTVKASAASR